MVKRIFIISLLLYFYGCADLAKVPDGDDSVPVPKADETVDSTGPETAHVPVNTELLYELLAAEIAGQRGQFEYALASYLKAVAWSGDSKIAERATQIALFLKDFDKAEQAVSVWVANDPDDETARKAAFLVYLNLNDNENALVHIRAWLNLTQTDFESKTVDLAKLMDKGSSTRLQIMENLAGIYGENADFLYAYSILALSKGDQNLALDKVNEALAIRDEWDKARLLKARILLKNEDTERVNASLRDLIDEYPNDFQVRYLYSQFLVKKGDYELARSELEQVVERGPEFHDAVFALAGLNLQLGDQKAAKTLFMRLVDVPLWSKQSYLFLGRIESSAENYDLALEWFDRISAGPLEVDAGLSAVLVLVKLGRIDEASRRLSGLRLRFPGESIRFLLLEADILSRKKQFIQAKSLLDKALMKNPEQSDLLYSRALVAEKMNRLDILEADLKTILKNNPDDVNALNALGYSLVDRTQRFAEASGYIERAIELSPNDPVIIDSFGWLQFKLGNHEEALKYLNRAFQKNPDPEIAAHLGEVFWVMGRFSEARKTWREAMDKNPQSEYLLKILRKYPKAFND